MVTTSEADRTGHPVRSGVRAFDLIGLGEGRVEFTADGSLTFSRTFQRRNAGDVPAALMAASGAGSKTGLISRVGDDPFGSGLLEAWQCAGLDTTYVTRTHGATRVRFIGTTLVDDRLERVQSEAEEARFDIGEPPKSMLSSSRAILLSGTTQALCAMARAATLSAAQLTRAGGGLVVYTPNHDPASWFAQGGREAARAAFVELAPFIDLLIVNLATDLEVLIRERLSVIQALHTLATLVPTVVLKASNGTTHISTCGLTRRVPAAALERRSHLANSSDAWNGLFLHAAIRGETITEAAKLANLLSCESAEPYASQSDPTAIASPSAGFTRTSDSTKLTA